MEKELLELFEAATKAADDAATNASSSGGSEEARCIDILKQLKDFPVTKDTLIATQVGKRVRNLKRHPSAKIQALASDLIETWKKAIIEETARNKSSGSSEDKNSAKVEKTEIVKVGKDQKADPMKIEKVAMTKITKVDRVERIISEKAPFSDTTKVEKIEIVKLDKKSNETECVKVEMISKSKEDKQASGMKKPLQASNCPPKLTSMFKCNDAARDKLREIIADALSRVSSEATEEIREEVNACDPIQVAVSVESVLFDKLGRRTGAQSLKYRSIVFNMQDRNNPDLRRRVLLGHIKPERLIVMTPEELASDRRKCQNNQIKEKALFDCERPDAPKATTDQFKCGRCGQRKCTYYQMQTRSADEPMTTFVTCVNCNNHWKFC